MIKLTVKGKPMIIRDEIIDRDIALLESEGRVGKTIGEVYTTERPDLHGLLTCFRDLRKYDLTQIISVCMDVCPHNRIGKDPADDELHLDNCWIHLFNALSLDGRNKYVEY